MPALLLSPRPPPLLLSPAALSPAAALRPSLPLPLLLSAVLARQRWTTRGRR
jgi:hypothetical protein